MEVEVSTLGQTWRGSVYARVCREGCCNNGELFFESQNQLKTSQVFPSIIPTYPQKYQKSLITAPQFHCLQIVYKTYFSFEAFGFAINSFVN